MKRLKRYWVQGCNPNTPEMKVYFKTNSQVEAIDKMKNLAKDCFIWDCFLRKLVDANYDCHIVNLY